MPLLASLVATYGLAEPETKLLQFIDESLNANFVEIDRSNKSAQITSQDNILRTCEADIQFKWRGQVSAGKNTLMVLCATPYWQKYVSVYFEVLDTVIIANQPLERSHPLEASSLTSQKMDISTLKLGYFNDAQRLEGYLLQRTVKSGQIITPYIVKPPALVKRGDWVTIMTGTKGLTVTAKGEALKDGVLGDQITVKNLTTHTNIKAWVINKGLVSTKQSLI